MDILACYLYGKKQCSNVILNLLTTEKFELIYSIKVFCQALGMQPIFADPMCYYIASPPFVASYFTIVAAVRQNKADGQFMNAE